NRALRAVYLRSESVLAAPSSRKILLEGTQAEVRAEHVVDPVSRPPIDRVTGPGELAGRSGSLPELIAITGVAFRQASRQLPANWRERPTPDRAYAANSADPAACLGAACESRRSPADCRLIPRLVR